MPNNAIIKAKQYQNISDVRNAQRDSALQKHTLQSALAEKNVAQDRGHMQGREQANSEGNEQAVLLEERFEKLSLYLEEKLYILALDTAYQIIEKNDHTDALYKLVIQALSLLDPSQPAIIKGNQKTLDLVRQHVWVSQVSFSEAPKFSDNQLDVTTKSGSVRIDIYDTLNAIAETIFKHTTK